MTRGPLTTARDFLAAHSEKLRFLVVGVGNTAVSYAMFVVLLAVLGDGLAALAGSNVAALRWAGGHNYLVVQWIAWVFMVPVSTTTMKYFVFRSRGKWLPQVGRGYFIYLPAQGLSSFLLWFFVRILGLIPQVGQLLTIGFTTVFSYLGHKYFTFRVPLEVGEVVPEDLMQGR